MKVKVTIREIATLFNDNKTLPVNHHFEFIAQPGENLIERAMKIWKFELNGDRKASIISLRVDESDGDDKDAFKAKQYEDKGEAVVIGLKTYDANNQ